MRDFLQDALNHRDDGYGRVQRAMRTQLPRRFYKEARAAALADGHAVLLDGRPTRTPGRVPIRIPTVAIAEHMAAEWNAQGQEIDPETMPVVRLVNAAVEAGAAAVPSLRNEVVKYAGSDLLYYRAHAPIELIEEQERRWDPILVALARLHDVAFETTHGIGYVAQPTKTLAAVSRALDPHGVYSLTALVLIASITSSALIALALRDRLIEAETAWQAAHIDENHNMRLWGADAEALRRLERRRRDFDAGVTVLSLAGGA